MVLVFLAGCPAPRVYQCAERGLVAEDVCIESTHVHVSNDFSGSEVPFNGTEYRGVCRRWETQQVPGCVRWEVRP